MTDMVSGVIVPTKRIFSSYTPVRVELSDGQTLMVTILKGGPWRMFVVGWRFTPAEAPAFDLWYPVPRYPWQIWRLIHPSSLMIRAADGRELGQIKPTSFFQTKWDLLVGSERYPVDMVRHEGDHYSGGDVTIEIPGPGKVEAKFSVSKVHLLLPVIAYAFYLWFRDRHGGG